MREFRRIEFLPDGIESVIHNTILEYDFIIAKDVGSIGDTIKKNVIGYAVVQTVQSDSSKSIQTIPMFERTGDGCDINYNIQIPENATVIDILPVSKPTIAVFGGVLNDDVTEREVHNTRFGMSLWFDGYTFLGIQSCNKELDNLTWEHMLHELWTEKLLKNYNARLENALMPEKEEVV